MEMEMEMVGGELREVDDMGFDSFACTTLNERLEVLKGRYTLVGRYINIQAWVEWGPTRPFPLSCLILTRVLYM